MRISILNWCIYCSHICDSVCSYQLICSLWHVNCHLVPCFDTVFVQFISKSINSLSCLFIGHDRTLHAYKRLVSILYERIRYQLCKRLCLYILLGFVSLFYDMHILIRHRNSYLFIPEVLIRSCFTEYPFLHECQLFKYARTYKAI